MTQIEQAMVIFFVLLGGACASVILVAAVWVVLSIAVGIRRLIRELR